MSQSRDVRIVFSHFYLFYELTSRPIAGKMNGTFRSMGFLCRLRAVITSIASYRQRTALHRGFRNEWNRVVFSDKPKFPTNALRVD